MSSWLHTSQIQHLNIASCYSLKGHGGSKAPGGTMTSRCSFHTTSLRPQHDSRRHFNAREPQSKTDWRSTADRRRNLTSEMLETGSSCTSVELRISGEVVSRISTATEIRRRALKDTPSPRPSFKSWCSSIRVYWRVEPYMLTQAGPRVGRNPGGDHFSSQVKLGFFCQVFSFRNQSANHPIFLYFHYQTLTSEVKELNGAHSFLFTIAPTIVFSLTFVTIVWNFAQINEVGSDGDVIDFVRVSDLDLDALAERREELSEDDLLVPNGLVAALLDCCLPLKEHNPNHIKALEIRVLLLCWGFKPDPEQSPHQTVHIYFTYKSLSTLQNHEERLLQVWSPSILITFLGGDFLVCMLCLVSVLCLQ